MLFTKGYGHWCEFIFEATHVVAIVLVKYQSELMFANTVLFHVFISDILCHKNMFLPKIQFQQPSVTSVTRNAMVLHLNVEWVSEGA